MTVHVDKPVNIRQLGRDLAALQGHDDPLPVNARLDDKTEEIVLVDAPADPAELQAAVEAHVAVWPWPDPPPDPIDVMRDAVKAARPDLKIATLLDHLDPILRDLRERRD